MMTPTAPMTAMISVFKFSSGCVTAEVPVPAAKQVVLISIIKVSENDRLDIFGKVLGKSDASAITGHYR